MGGHKKGEVASDLASKTMYKDFDSITDYVKLQIEIF
jgi:serine/threonine protein phosphatase PrpC